jgi:hypothetical protein
MVGMGRDVLSMPSSKIALETIKSDLQDFESVSAVTMNIRAHYEHLEALANNLRAIGMDDSEINEHVVALFESYKAELTKIIADL